MQYVTMIKNDPITGVEYGTVDVPAETIETKKTYENVQKIKNIRRQTFQRNNIKRK